VAASPTTTSTSTSTPNTAPTSALSPDQLAAITQGRERARKIRRAASFAAFSGWSMVLFAVITGLGALFGSISSFIVASALAYVAYRELKGGTLIRSFDLRGVKLLVRNQLLLGTLIVAYAGWSIINSLQTDPLAAIGGSTGDPSIDGLAQQLTSVVTWGVYGTMAVLGIVIPAATAWYYASRGTALERFKRETPDWVVEALNASA
jgi:type IV secretory pathway VirB2 component (pilin)